MLFRSRTIRKPTKKDYTNDLIEALAICRNELGEVDIHYIEKLTLKSYDEIIAGLKDEIFQNPDKEFHENIKEQKYIGWETRADYLSGNIIDKINSCKYYSERVEIEQDIDISEKERIKSRMKEYESILKKVEPKKLTAKDIRVRLGITWIEEEDYARFLESLLKASYKSVKVFYNRYNGTYGIEAPSYLKHRAEARNVWGTERISLLEIFDCTINNRPVTVWDKIKIPDGERRIVNKAETAMARELARKLNIEFEKWLWSGNKKDVYENKYNNMFNGYVVPVYSGKHMKFEIGRAHV